MRSFFVALVLGVTGTLSAQRYETGLVFVDPAVYQGIPLASTPLMGNLPSSADLSSYFPAPGNQGQQASCVGWAVAYALKGYQERRERGWQANTSAELFSPAFIYNQIRRSADCRGGTSFVDALNLLRRDGVATMQDFPYSEQVCSSTPDASVKQKARPFAIADWRRVNTQDETEVKTNIAAGFPVLIAMMVDVPFMQLRSGIYRQYSGIDLGGHAMVAIGYDDERAAFKVINSWGGEWGDGGFGWISYIAFRQAVREGYVAQDIILQPPGPDPKPQPIPRPEPRPQPQPTPERRPSTTLYGLEITHNVPVRHQAGLAAGPGMLFRLRGRIDDAQGRKAQVVVRFAYQNGPELFANPQEPSYRDVGGLVATGTQSFVLQSMSNSTDGLSISIPYYALNFQPMNGMGTYQLTATAFVYVDDFIIGQSAPTPFMLRW